MIIIIINNSYWTLYCPVCSEDLWSQPLWLLYTNKCVDWLIDWRVQVQAPKEPLGLLRSDGERPDGVTLIPWSRGRCLTLDVTVPDIFAASHLPATSLAAGAAAEKAASMKTNKYEDQTTDNTSVRTQRDWNFWSFQPNKFRVHHCTRKSFRTRNWQ